MAEIISHPLSETLTLSSLCFLLYNKKYIPFNVTNKVIKSFVNVIVCRLLPFNILNNKNFSPQC